jgi:hypothetical protein
MPATPVKVVLPCHASSCAFRSRSPSLATPVAMSRAGAAEFIVRPVTIAEMKAVFGQVRESDRRAGAGPHRRLGSRVARQSGRRGQGGRRHRDRRRRQALRFSSKAADAKIEALNSQFENARIQFERAQQLRASGTGTQASLDQARMQFEVAANQVAAAKAEKTVIEQSAREGSGAAPATGPRV